MVDGLVLWASADPEYLTGYGQQTSIWTQKFRDEGINIEIAAMGGLKGVPRIWNGIKVWPVENFFDLAELYQRRGAELLIGLRDVWTINSEIYAEANLRSAFWTPIDCDPMSFADLAHIRNARATPIAMSRFGARMMRRAGLEHFLYVPHGIDTDFWTPHDNPDSLRERVGIPPDTFVIGINATNIDVYRKGWYEQLEAFATFHKEHPNSTLMVNTLLQDEGTNIEYLTYMLGISDCVSSTDQWMYKQGLITNPILRDWYRSCHILSNCSWGEGFGLPIIEAQACGIPTVVTDFSSMPEVAYGWKVEGEYKWNATHNGRWLAPYVGSIYEAYEEAYQMWQGDQERWKQFCQQARTLSKKYSVDHVYAQYWRPALNALDRGRQIVYEAAGFKWKVDVDINSGDGLGPHHEDSVEQVMLTLIPPGGVFLDVGAHVGHYSIRASKVARKVIAIEPNPETAQRLRENIELNNILNITVYQLAAWDEGAALSMFSPTHTTRDGSYRTIPGKGDLMVQGRPLDNVLKDERQIDVIKLDVEGADLHALRGMRKTITRCKPVMFIEDHSIYDYYPRQELLDLITELGYTCVDGGLYGTANYFICRPK